MKKSLIILLGSILCLSACAPAYYGPPTYAGPAVGYSVEVGDQPYYTRGPYYVQRGVRYVWVPGHWGHRHAHRVWVHGRYVIR